MSQERFDRIAPYGSKFTKTPGCESNVKKIYDECKKLAQDPSIRVLNQFEGMANYRFHYHVTGNSAAATAALTGPLAGRLREKRVGVPVCGTNIDAESFSKHLLAANR